MMFGFSILFISDWPAGFEKVARDGACTGLVESSLPENHCNRPHTSQGPANVCRMASVFFNVNL